MAETLQVAFSNSFLCMKIVSIIKMIFVQIPEKFGPKGPINNKPSLVEIMAWHQTGNKPLVQPVMA